MTPTVETRTVRYQDDDLNMVGTIRVEASPYGSRPSAYHGLPEHYEPQEGCRFDVDITVESITETFYNEDGEVTGVQTFDYPHDDGHIVDSDRVNAFVVSFHNSAKFDELMNELEYFF